VRRHRRFRGPAALCLLFFHTDAFEASGHLSERREGKLPGPTYFAYPAIATVSFVRHALLVSIEANRRMEKRVASTSKYSSGILFSSSTQYNNNENYNNCTNSKKLYKNIILKKCKEWFEPT
jgi:hypothetical protein